MKCPNFVQNGKCNGSSRGDIAECLRVGYDGCREVIRMIEYKDYAKFESLSEMSEAIEMGLDSLFFLGKGTISPGGITSRLYANVLKEKLCSTLMLRRCLIRIK